MSRRFTVLAGAALLAALAPGLAAAKDTPVAAAADPSYFTRLWELDEASRASRSVFSPYHTTYVLPFTSNCSPNRAVFEGVEPPRTLMRSEAAFQLSFKARLWQDAFGGRVDLWLGYTQRAFWQVYDIEESAPFREIDHEPEIIASVRTRFRVLGFDGRFVQIAVNHQSNGLTKPLSRNWNRLIANVGLERGPLSLLVTGWVRVFFKPGENENPGLSRYAGYGELEAFYFYRGHRFGARFRDNLNFRFNRAAFQADWAFPLFARIGGIVQAYFGYGESLLDFDHRVSRIGVGIVLRDWD